MKGGGIITSTKLLYLEDFTLLTCEAEVVELKLPWIPVKGYHFPEGPYVECSAVMNETEREALKI